MAAENQASQESALGAYSPVDYMSITSFPRLPEDEPAPAAPLRGRKDEDAFLGDPETGEALPAGPFRSSSPRAVPRLDPLGIRPPGRVMPFPGPLSLLLPGPCPCMHA